MEHDSKTVQETKPQARAQRLWFYEHTTPLHGAYDRNGNEIVVTTVASYDIDRQRLVIECVTPASNERSVVDCSQWRGPCAPGAGVAIRALAEFEDHVLDAVRAWARVERARRNDDDGLDRRAREAAGETER